MESPGKPRPADGLEQSGGHGDFALCANNYDETCQAYGKAATPPIDTDRRG
jgi:hypothetical protein